jgi:hypothetical protein
LHPNFAPRPRICFIYLPEFCSLAAREISWRDLRKKTGVQECPTDTDLYLQKGYFL